MSDDHECDENGPTSSDETTKMRGGVRIRTEYEVRHCSQCKRVKRYVEVAEWEE